MKWEILYLLKQTTGNDMRNVTTDYPFHDMPKHKDTLTFAERLALAVNNDDLPLIEYTPVKEKK